MRPVTIGCDLVAYGIENLYRHLPDTYLALLGAPPLPFSILFGTIVAPREMAAGDAVRLPVVYV